MQKVLAAVLEKNGKVLVARRRKGDRFEGLWEFPGGKLEKGETPEACLRRELAEELGVEVRVGDFLGSTKYTSAALSIELLAYEVVHLSGEFCLHDHEEMRWVRPRDLSRYRLTEPDAALLARLKILRPR